MTRPSLADITQRARLSVRSGGSCYSDASAVDAPALLAAIRDVLAVHVEATCSRGYPQAYCVDCDQAWPCATVRAITAHIDTTTKETP